MNPFWEQYLSYLKTHALACVLVFFIGRSLRRAIGAESEKRRIHGRYVFWWAFGTFAIGGPLGPLLFKVELGFGSDGFGWFCLLLGWLIGMIHGAIVLAFRPSRSQANNRVGPMQNEE
ncbi:MAG: hypothetical protein KF873_16620 [Gemmataceae bacterium]|nr:hypothetical protein [Gemmataceae bacterium]